MNFDNFISIAPGSIRNTLVDDLQHIISDHRGWLNQVLQATVTKLPSLSIQIESDEAHKKCSMSEFEFKIKTKELHTHRTTIGDKT